MAGLSKFKSKAYPFELDFGDGDIIKGKVLAHSQGQAEAQALKKRFEDTADDDKEAARTVYGLFKDQIPQWDLCDDNKEGNPLIPLTVEGLEEADVPFRLLLDILSGAHEQAETVKKPRPKR